MGTWTFAKGHGTENDFVILLDRHGMCDPSPEAVRYLCDRHAGIGGDGLLRVVPGRQVADWDGDPDLWFMDYRNADGSLAQMCGNGSRVFAKYLIEAGLADGPRLRIGTRAGEKAIEAHPGNERFTVDMGVVAVGASVTVEHGGQDWAATAADVGNPHAVVVLPEGEGLADLDLDTAPRWRPVEAFPEGTNVEFVTVLTDDHAAMRVHERGVGETWSCGTGTVAVAAVLGRDVPGEHRRRINVRGGSLIIDLGPAESVDGSGPARRARMTGPAVIVATGEVQVPDALRVPQPA